MGLSLRGQTSGAVDINAPAVAGDNTITLPDGNGSANQFYKNSTTAGIVTHSSMVEDASGRVAIGFANPAVSGLSISNSSSNRGFEFDTATGFADNSCIRAYDRPTAAYRSLGLTGSDIRLGINDVERVRVSIAGSVGIGTDDPVEKLTVAGNVRIENSSDASQYLTINHQGINFQNTGAGSSTTATAHTLDDYEEGNFTPVLGYANTTLLSNVTISRRSGTYIKVGSIVWFQLDIAASIAWGSIGTINNGLQIQGLPFICQAVAPFETGSSYIAVPCVPRHWTTPWPTSQSPTNDPPLWKVGHTETWLTSYISRNANSDYVYRVSDWDAAASNGTATFEIQLQGTYSTTS